jgi:hypothetical protein
MQVRTYEDIERAFLEMGLSEATWGAPSAPQEERHAPSLTLFIRNEATTTPVERKENAHLAQPPE